MNSALRHTSNWQALGNCSDIDPDIMHPDEHGANRAARIEAAKWVCWGCPVARQCLADGMENEDWHGVRAGLTGDYRRKHNWMSIDKLLAIGGVGA